MSGRRTWSLTAALGFALVATGCDKTGKETDEPSGDSATS